ncbi:MAG: methyl-accepting chemotaxis protein [Alphaproteobacteria bacterium]
MAFLPNLSIQQKLTAAFFSLVVLSAAAGGVGLLSSWRIGESGIDLGAKLAPLGDAAMEIKLTATTAHLFFEEIMAGDGGEDIEEVWALLAETQFYADAILNGGENDEGRFYPAESPAVRQKIESVRQQVQAFIDSARQRYQRHIQGQGTGTGADQAFDDLYEGLLGDLDQLAEEAEAAPAASALPVIAAVGRAKFHLANGHLFLEEVLSGDEGESIDDVLADFDVARTAIASIESPKVEAIAKDIRKLAEVAAERYRSLSSHLAADSAAVDAFDETFETFIREADEAEEVVHDFMARSLADLQAIKRFGMISTLVLMLATVIAALGLGLYFRRSIAARLNILAGTVSRLVAGTQVDIPGAEIRDEIGDLARAFAAFAEQGVTGLRIKLALDNADVSIMVADADHNIVYVNERLLDMFRAAEADIKKDLPNFRTNALIGANIDQFHKVPNQQRGMLARLDRTHKAEIEVGGRSFTFIANPVRGGDGQRLGTVVEWRDLTEELAIQGEIDKVVEAAGAGDFSRRIDTAGRQGTLARLAGGINHLTNLVEGATTDLGAVLAALAEGNLTRRITADYQGTLGELKDNANLTADKLADIVARIQASTVEVENAASEISSGTQDLSDRTEQAASSLEETAASADQMAATVRQNAENAKRASDLASGANHDAKSGGDVVGQAVSAMRLIEQSAQKITDIISVIDEIAFQTNLLALNASVEAARAGEAGKGFAVVAQEVRQLAQRAAQAASDIKTLIQDSNGQVKAGVELVNRAGNALAGIVDSIGKVTDIVEQISNASQEQAAGVQEINSSITSMDEMTQQNSALVEESTAAARALSEQANSLAQLMSFFKSTRSGKPAAAGTTIKAETRQTTRKPVAPAAQDEGWSEF